MAHLLYHWRYDNYCHDLNMGVGFHLNQNASALEKINRGDSLWAFTRREDKQYVFAAELVCHRKTLNSNDYPYGQYRIWGHLNESRYFDLAPQFDITQLIRSFQIKTGRDGTPLGQAFQGNAAVRTISNDEHLLLRSWAQDFRLEIRAKLLPEDLLERETHDFFTVFKEVQSPKLPISDTRRAYLIKAHSRRFSLVRELRNRYEGRCQITGWDPRREHSRDLCEAHHVQWLSRGGDDELHNLVLISPNIHRLIHSSDAPFDYESRSFKFDDSSLAMQLDRHDLKPNLYEC